MEGKTVKINKSAPLEYGIKTLTRNAMNELKVKYYLLPLLFTVQ